MQQGKKLPIGEANTQDTKLYPRATRHVRHGRYALFLNYVNTETPQYSFFYIIHAVVEEANTSDVPDVTHLLFHEMYGLI